MVRCEGSSFCEEPLTSLEFFYQVLRFHFSHQRHLKIIQVCALDLASHPECPRTLFSQSRLGYTPGSPQPLKGSAVQKMDRCYYYLGSMTVTASGFYAEIRLLHIFWPLYFVTNPVTLCKTTVLLISLSQDIWYTAWCDSLDKHTQHWGRWHLLCWFGATVNLD